jgi:hypothetical protein
MPEPVHGPPARRDRRTQSAFAVTILAQSGQSAPRDGVGAGPIVGTILG